MPDDVLTWDSEMNTGVGDPCEASVLEPLGLPWANLDLPFRV